MSGSAAPSGAFDLDDSIVEIEGLESMGTGFFVGDRTHILTCSHVVLAGTAQRSGTAVPEYVSVRRPGDLTWHLCLVDQRSWSGIDGEDVAVLRCFAFAESDGIRPLPLTASRTERGPVGATFYSHGFPDLGGIGPIRFTVEIERVTFNHHDASASHEATVSPLLQVTKSSGLTNGCSGAPAIDDADGSVLGMVRLMATPDVHGSLTDIAFLTPSAILIDLHPTLSPPERNERPLVTLIGRDVPWTSPDIGKDLLLAIAAPTEKGAWRKGYVSTAAGRLFELTFGTDAPYSRSAQLEEVASLEVGPFISVSPQGLVLIGFPKWPGPGVTRVQLMGKERNPELLTLDGWKPYPEVTNFADSAVPVDCVSKPVFAPAIGGWAGLQDDVNSLYYISEADHAVARLSLQPPFDRVHLCRPPLKSPPFKKSLDCDLAVSSVDGRTCFVIVDPTLGIIWRWYLDSPETDAEIVAGGGAAALEDGIRGTLAKLKPGRVALEGRQIYFSETNSPRIFRCFDDKIWHVAGSGAEDLFGEVADARLGNLGIVWSMAWIPGSGLAIIQGSPYNSLRLVKE